MRGTAVSRRYARALFSLAREEDRVEAVRGELDDLEQLLEASPEFKQSIFRPVHPVAERRAVLRGVSERLGTSPTVRSFYSLLIDQRRLIHFAAIREEFDRLADELVGRTRAEVVSASPLDDDQRERLQRALSRRTGREVELDVRIDPSLMGGAVATVGGRVFDGSLRTQLAQLRASLTKEQ